jgi:hypothetical protein
MAKLGLLGHGDFLRLANSVYLLSKRICSAIPFLRLFDVNFI